MTEVKDATPAPSRQIDAMPTGFREHRLGVKITGRRKIIYACGWVIAAPVLATVWILVGLEVIPPQPTNVIITIAIFPVLFIPFVALWDNPGEKRTWLERMSEFAFVWLLVSGVTQATWELGWWVLDASGVIQGATAADHWLWGWWLYGVADTRYLTSNPTISGLEFCASVAGPLELYGCYLLKRGKRIQGNWWALFLGWGLTWATFVFFLAEWHVGWKNIHGGWYGFWVVFVGLNLPWLVAPLISMPASVRELKYLYEKRMFDRMLGESRPIGGSDPTGYRPLDQLPDMRA